MREVIKFQPVAFNVPSRPVLLSDLKREETERQMEEAFEQMLRVRKLINIYSASSEDANLPSDGLERLRGWHDSLRARFNRLTNNK